jgi:dihydroorotate dehydrogenase (NAD+) catalytic subunit
LCGFGVSLWVSVGGFCADDFAETCSQLAGVEAIELNLSCPNVNEAADSAAEIVAACRRSTELPLYAKLSAAHPDVAEVARAVAAAGADGLSLINTLRATALDKHLRPVLARGSGGLSGPALKPIALHAVSVCHEATGLPIVGMGGIETGGDALEFAACGARDIALGTVLFADPGAPARVRAELAAACADAGVATPDNARSLAKSPETQRKVHA